MTIDEIKAKAESFFEFPTENKDHVTTTSAVLFARHILEFADCSANCHQFHDSVSDCVKMVATRCAEIASNEVHRSTYSVNGGEIARAIKVEFNLSD